MKRFFHIFLFFLISSSSVSGQTWEDLIAQSRTYFQQEQPDSAIYFMEKALQQALTEFGKAHSNYNETLKNLVLLYKSAGKFEKAAELELGVAVTLREADKKTNEFKEKGDYQTAIGWAEKALTLAENEFGRQHETYALFLNNLAEVYRLMSRYEPAEPLYKRARYTIKMQNHLYGKNEKSKVPS